MFRGTVGGSIGGRGTVPRSVLNSVCVILITLILSYFNIFQELVPKRIARAGGSLSLKLSGIYGSYLLSSRLSWLLTVSTNGLLN
ncbi:MAG: hypothetical protein ACLRSW_14000 [Christensenellaceae bacterium]